MTENATAETLNGVAEQKVAMEMLKVVTAETGDAMEMLNDAMEI